MNRSFSLPTLVYPPELPVSRRKDDIAAAIREHQVVVVAGETGSGKTTQLPKICLELGRGVDQMIGHTQPRRIAARTVAERVAEEIGVPLGGLVGYQMRFTDHSTPDTMVKLMTDGILLAAMQRDRLLSAYDTLIIDEAHERSLNIDFILGYLAQLLPRRPDLKVVITSATIDPHKFAAHFADARGRPAPVVEVSGRTYPVEVRYRPLVEALDDEGDMLVRDQTEAIVDAVRELMHLGPGDILVFLPGEREIRDTADVLQKMTMSRAADTFEVVPLYARLSSAEQHRVFESSDRRRVVLATNVAETSLTVPGIRYVVDTGVARISRYSSRTKVQRLPIEAISQASANQRAGRCGRLEAGVAIRLYAEEDFLARPEFTDPEIVRTNLASVILQMTALGLGDVAAFPFLDPPDRRQIAAGVQLLEELGALASGETGAGRPRRTEGAGQPSETGGSTRKNPRVNAPEPAGQLTGVGRKLAALPVDPRLGRMIVEADRRGCLREVLVIAAALSVPDPRERPAEQQARADQMHARFRDPSSDFLSFLNLWRHLRTSQRELSSSAFRRMCRTEHLNYLRIREWQEVEAQLRQTAKHLRMTSGSAADEPDQDAIHQSLLAGLLSHIGLRDEARRDYLGARGARFSIFPGSALFKKQPAFVMAAELVETSKLYARVNAAARPEWAEEVGASQVRRSYSEPHWSKRRAAVMAKERVTLYGVPLVVDRTVPYAAVDPALSRELFIRHALVYGEWETRHRFFSENRALLREAEALEHRARRHDLVVDEHSLFEFYDARVGPAVVSGAHFDSWWKRARRKRPDLLTFETSMLLTESAAAISADDYPDEWRTGSVTLPLRYHFAPGAADDGVTVDLPVQALSQVSEDQFSWQVPGLREELVTSLLRSLPKQLRVSFVPARDHARAFLSSVTPGDEPLLDALERHLRAATGVVVPREAWDWSKVPEHLRPTFRVLDGEGAELAQGKHLGALKAPHVMSIGEAIAEAGEEIAVTGQTAWTFGSIPEVFSRMRGGHEVVGYPAMVDEGATVGLRVLGTDGEQRAAHQLGVRRLLLLATDPSGAQAKRVAGTLGNADRLTLAASPYSTVQALLDDCLLAAAGALVAEAQPARDQAAFDELSAFARDQLPTRASAVVADVLTVLDAWREADRALTGRAELTLLPALSDMRAQVDRLVRPGFVAEVGAGRLRELPRYLSAVRLRRERLDFSVARDRELMDRVAPLQAAYLHRVDALPAGTAPSSALVDVRWLLEEYRVSLWAQQLGTKQPVSDTRIRKALDAL